MLRRKFLEKMAGCGMPILAASKLLKGNDAKSAQGRDYRFTTSRGDTIGFRSYGDAKGKPVIYFHGTPSSRLEASLIAETCNAHGIHLVAVDRPGMGISSFKSDHSQTKWATDVGLVIDWLTTKSGAASVGLLAMSGGTSFALACAARYPSKTNRLAIVSPRTPAAPSVPITPIDRRILAVRRRPKLAEIFLNRQFAKLRRTDSDPSQAQSFRLFAPVDLEFLRKNRVWLAQGLLEASRCGTKGLLRDTELLPWPWGFNLKCVSVPVKCWLGTCDFSAPLATTEFLERNILYSKTCRLKGDGHFTSLATAADDFLAWLCGSQ